MDKKACFVAYPSNPPALAETLERAIEEIHNGSVVEMKGWKSTVVNGKFIITAICDAILEADIFVCDLTELNHNVLFELGFAIAKKKRIWILIDPSINQSKENYEKFSALTTIGYTSYTNSRNIVDEFYSDEPYKDTDSAIFNDAINQATQRGNRDSILYLKSSVDTESSIKLSQRIDSSKINQVVDDPSEVPMQTLSWYVQQLDSSLCVIVHFLSLEHLGSKLHNAKNSFVSGLAYGFDKPLLMLAHAPFSPPIDYHDLLQIHKTAAECVTFANDWLENLESQYDQRSRAIRSYEKEVLAQRKLQDISIGDPIAEHESDELDEYFIETSAYKEAISANQSIFIGRKGCGKTANLLKIASDLKSDTRNHVTIIKPVAYELEGIIRMLQIAIHAAEKGYLIESFWKFLIYTELAKSIYDKISSLAQFQLDDNENELLEFVNEHNTIIKPDFSIRLETAVNSLKDFENQSTAEKQRIRISELLHNEIITKLRNILGQVLESKNRVVILIDNLDKAWNRGSDFSLLSDLLLGLLRTTHAIERDFRKTDHWRKSVNLSMIIFLRSDIFTYIIKNYREPDKVRFFRIDWHDRELLLRVIERRFMVNTEITSPDEIWTRYFCSEINGVPTKEHITTSILPRPRDVIFLCKEAIAQAVNRGHTMVEQKDILDAEKQYSKFALDSLLVENGISVEKLEELLYEFAGSPDIIDIQDLIKAMVNCKISDDKFSDVVDHLCKLNFLGVEVDKDRFEYIYNEEDEKKLQALSRKFQERINAKSRRFQINKPFHAYLEIST